MDISCTCRSLWILSIFLVLSWQKKGQPLWNGGSLHPAGKVKNAFRIKLGTNLQASFFFVKVHEDYNWVEEKVFCTIFCTVVHTVHYNFCIFIQLWVWGFFFDSLAALVSVYHAFRYTCRWQTYRYLHAFSQAYLYPRFPHPILSKLNISAKRNTTPSVLVNCLVAKKWITFSSWFLYTVMIV